MAMIWQLRVYALLAALTVGLAAPATSAWAHPRVAPADAAEEVPAAVPAPAPAVPAPAAPPMDPLAPTVALAVALGGALIARRRMLVSAVALGLVVLAVETGVHSVHHLADQQAAAECTVALASANVHGAAEGPPATHAMWISVPVGVVVALALALERPGPRPLRPDEGRAPPAA